MTALSPHSSHMPPDQIDGGCLICAECDGIEGHDGPHDCGHEDHA